MSEIYQDGRQPLVGLGTTAERRYMVNGPVYVPVSEIQASQPIRRETVRVIRRHVQTKDGRVGLEITEEHDVIYAPPRATPGREHDGVRAGLAGIVAFLVICLTFTMFGGGDQSAALIPLYWGAFAALWWALA